MTIIFDLDYTLFDAKNFKHALARALEISPEMFNNDYDKYFVKTKINYSVNKHLSILRREGRIKSIVDTKKRVAGLMRNIDKFLFTEISNILQKLKQRKFKLFLVTFGEKSWQKAKIKHLRIKNYFAKIFYTETDKSKIFKRFKKIKGVIVVNDNARECMAIKKVLPQAQIILLRGPYSNNIEHNFKPITIKSLNKLL